MHARQAYRKHCADVLHNCPKENLVVLENLKDQSYGKICAKIGIEVPKSVADKADEWPNANANQKWVKEIVKKTNNQYDLVLIRVLKWAVLIGLASFFANKILMIFQ